VGHVPFFSFFKNYLFFFLVALNLAQTSASHGAQSLAGKVHGGGMRRRIDWSHTGYCGCRRGAWLFYFYSLPF
jgi:hypothetical protein